MIFSTLFVKLDLSTYTGLRNVYYARNSRIDFVQNDNLLCKYYKMAFKYLAFKSWACYQFVNNL